MTQQDQSIVQTIVTSAALGGFAFMAIVGWVLVFDISSIATMIAGAGERDLMSALFLGGSLTKGVTVGTAFGLVLAARPHGSPRLAPATSAAPALS